MSKKRLRRWFVFAIALIVAFFGIYAFFFLRNPLLTDVHPLQARPGNAITVEGLFLGKQHPSSSLQVGNQRITSSHILEWKPNQIRFRMPDGLRSGDLLVSRTQGESNPIFLTNVNTIPRPLVQSDDNDLVANLVEEQYESYWELFLAGKEDLNHFEFYLDGYRLPSFHRFSLDRNRLGVYIPASMLTLDGEPSPALLFSHLEYRQGDLNLQRETFDIKAGGNSTLYSNAAGPLLYQLTITFAPSNAATLTNDDSELLLHLPLPELADFTLSVETAFPGWVQLLPFTEDYVPVRLLPHSTLKGSITLNIHGRIINRAPGSRLLTATDDYEPSGLLLPLYEDYLVPQPEPVLAATQRRALNNALGGIGGALPVARAMYEWFSETLASETGASETLASEAGASETGASEQELGGELEAFVDELRRRNIAARRRLGYIGTEQNGYFGLSTTTWVEIFFPRWGWISVYRESMVAGAPFGEVLHRHIMLPLVESFPALYTPDGGKVEEVLRLLVQPGDAIRL